MVAVTVARFEHAVEALLALGWMRLAAPRHTALRWRRLAGVGASAYGFGARPDWHRLAVIAVWDGPVRRLRHIDAYLDRRAETVERWTLAPVRWQGSWGRTDPFAGARPRRGDTGAVAVITHATVRARVLPRFWRRVPPVAETAARSEGYQRGFGFGAIPLVALATFSVWDDTAAMTRFAWSAGAHAAIVGEARSQGWFGEAFFARVGVVDHAVTRGRVRRGGGR
jgi:hypothetical protein